MDQASVKGRANTSEMEDNANASLSNLGRGYGQRNGAGNIVESSIQSSIWSLWIEGVSTWALTTTASNSTPAKRCTDQHMENMKCSSCLGPQHFLTYVCVNSCLWCLSFTHTHISLDALKLEDEEGKVASLDDITEFYRDMFCIIMPILYVVRRASCLSRAWRAGKLRQRKTKCSRSLLFEIWACGTQISHRHAQPVLTSPCNESMKPSYIQHWSST